MGSWQKVCLINGGDSAIGKAVALLFAQEGADIAISYLSEDEDAEQTKSEVEAYGRKCLLIKYDISEEKNCEVTITETLNHFAQLNILVNNAALHWESESIEEISTDQLLKNFNTNFFSYFWMTKYAMPHFNEGACIINTTSVNAYRGSPSLIDYSATKSPIVSFARSMANNLVKKSIELMQSHRPYLDAIYCLIIRCRESFKNWQRFTHATCRYAK